SQTVSSRPGREHMLVLADELRKRYQVSFVCPPSPSGRTVLERATALEVGVLPLEVRGDRRAEGSLCHWLRSR
ncbi:MAG: hypothetical protein M3336_17520, partial [Chloroflexota bacterium]|nr:hypothetical protein [Chloroflexota bacterium]